MKHINLIEKIADKYRKNRLASILFKNIYHKVYTNKLEKTKRKNFHKYATDLLYVFDKSLKSINCNYTLAFGTLLGAIREGNFIKHDLDIDVTIKSEDYSENINKILSENGFTKIREITVDKGKFAREETYKYKGVSIDIFYLYPTNIDNLRYCCDFTSMGESWSEYIKNNGGLKPRKITLPIGENINFEFKNIVVQIPINYTEILEKRYGINYMKPDPNWQPKENKYLITLEDKIGIVKGSINE